MRERAGKFIAVIGDREALVWVLEQQRIAFPLPRSPLLFPTLRPDDVLYLYTTRSCYKNPTRDRGLVIGAAEVVTALTLADEPLQVRDRTMPLQADLNIRSLAPVTAGVDVSDRAASMDSFPKPESWAVYLRRSLLPLTDRDAREFDRRLRSYEGGRIDQLDGYRRRAKVAA